LRSSVNNLAIELHSHHAQAQIAGEVNFLALHQKNPTRYPFFLESHRFTNDNSRFDILFAFPGEVIECSSLSDHRFFQRFETTFNAASKVSDDISELPFRGGWFLFLSYELIGLIEAKLASLPINAKLPIASATRIPLAIIKDHKYKKTWLVCEKGSEGLFTDVLQDLDGSCYSPREPSISGLKEEDKPAFIANVEKVLKYLKEGDTLQVNLSRLWQARLPENISYLDIYQALRDHNPAPFSGLAIIADQVICSSSPERLVRNKSGVVDMRPIAGTRPRNTDSKLDKALADQLLADGKESAEHIMLLDLIRNDLGRICKTGTVEVDETMVLESYASVHHIVSNVRGLLSKGLTPIDIIKAVFPGGTITGCPKVRCMEIINELEGLPRGIYTGSMGYVNLNGDMDLNILIRSMLINGRSLTFRAGAGIVADSKAENELKETQHKAEGLIKALGCYAN